MESSIQHLLDAKQYKQAEKQARNKLKKKPTNVSLLIQLVNVLLEVGDLGECLAECVKLCIREEPVTDLMDVMDIYSVLCRLNLRNGSFNSIHLTKLWGRALKVAANKIHYAERWANLAIRYAQWDHLIMASVALQASASLEKEKRKYHFWKITASFLASLPPLAGMTGRRPDTASQKRYRDSAVKSLEKSVLDITGIQIKEPAEVKLLMAIYLIDKKYAKLADLLSEKTVAPIRDQEITRLGLEVMKINMMESAGSERAIWDRTVWDLAKKTLDKAVEQKADYRIDDCYYWIVMEAASPSSEDLTAILTFASEVCDTAGTLRAPHYMKMHLSWAQHFYNEARDAEGILARSRSTKQPGTLQSSLNGREQLITSYFKRFATTNFVSSDIGWYVTELNSAEFLQARNHIGKYVQNDKGRETSDADFMWLRSEINALRIDFNQIKRFRVSAEQKQAVRKLLNAFVCNCLRLYRLSRTHPHKLPETATKPGDEACMLAVEAMYFLHNLLPLPGVNLLVMATGLLAFLSSESKHNSDARLELVGMAKDLGLASVAWEAFEGLRVKKVLFEPLSAVFFDRIGAYHPFPSKSLDAYEAMREPLRFYSDSVTEIARYQEMALKHGNYEQVIGMQAFADQLETSVTRMIMVFERRRIARLTGKPYDKYDTMFDTFDFVEILDALNSKPLPDRVCTRVDWHHRLASKVYINWLIAHDAAIEIANSPTIVLREREEVRTMIGAFATENMSVVEENLWPFEAKLLATDNALMLCIETLRRPKLNLEAIEGNFKYLESELRDFFNDDSCLEKYNGREIEMMFPHPQWLSEAYLTIEYCQVLKNLAGTVQQRLGSKKSNDVNDLQIFAEDRFEFVLARAKEFKQAMRRLDSTSLFSDMPNGYDDIAEEMGALVGGIRLRRSFDGFMESARDTLDGIMRAKLV